MALDTGFQLLLIGKSGVGKSAFGNFVLNGKYFKVSVQSSSMTQEIKAIPYLVDDVAMTIVDTPGLLSNDRSLLRTAIELQTFLLLDRSKSYVFLIVLELGRTTPEDVETISLIRVMFGPECLKHGILIFTHEDKARNEGENIETLMRNFSEIPEYKTLLEECGGRYLNVHCYEKDKKVKETKLKELMRMIVDAHRNNRFYMPDLKLYREVLERYVDKWKESRLNADKIEILLMEMKKGNHMKTKLICSGIGLLSLTFIGGVVTVTCHANSTAAAGTGVVTTGINVDTEVTSSIDLMGMLEKLNTMQTRISAVSVITSPIVLPLAFHKSKSTKMF